MEILTSVIIPVFNQWAFTKQMLDSLFDNNDMSKVAVIVVDNGSTDKTFEGVISMLQNGRPISTICHKENLGVAKAWNAGIKFAIETFNSKYFIIMNNDILVPKNLILNYLKCFEENSDVYAVNAYFTRRLPIPADFWKKSAEMSEQPLQIKDTWAIGGFCFGLKRETIDKIGLFDETFGRFCKEDRDYMRRMKIAGLRSVQLLNVWIHHFENTTLNKIPNFLQHIAEVDKNYNKKWGQ